MSLSPEDRRSWLLNEAAISAAAQDWPRAEALIREKLARLRARDAASPDLIRDYEALLDQGFERFRAEVLAYTERAQSLRSLHPLAGLIDPKRRSAILREARRQ